MWRGERQRLSAGCSLRNGDIARPFAGRDPVGGIVSRRIDSQQQRPAFIAERKTLAVDCDEIVKPIGAVEFLVVDRDDDAARVVLDNDLLVEFARCVVGHDIALNRDIRRDAGRTVVIERLEYADTLHAGRSGSVVLHTLFERQLFLVAASGKTDDANCQRTEFNENSRFHRAFGE